jgi:tetratricopeptide (TPR) repeat protein
MKPQLKAFGLGLVVAILLVVVSVLGHRVYVVQRDAKALLQTPVGVIDGKSSPPSINSQAAAQRAGDSGTNGGAHTPEQRAQAARLQLRLAVVKKQYSKAAEYGQQIFETGAARTDDLTMMAELYSLSKDCRNAVLWADKAISAAHQAGEAPREYLHKLKLRCAIAADDSASIIAALADLIRLTNKDEYWKQLIKVLLQGQNDPHNLLMIYRVMYNLDAIDTTSDYTEMAQLLLETELPGEAGSVLKKAFADSALEGQFRDDTRLRDRTLRLLELAQRRADVDREKLDELEVESATGRAGEGDVKLGQIYYGFSDYQNAVLALLRAFEKGQIKRLDDAYVYLGLTQAALQNKTEARKAFAGLKKVATLNPGVIKLWELYAEKKI